MLNQYMVEFSYQGPDKRIREHDIFWATNTPEAVRECQYYYEDELHPDLKITSVYKDAGTDWEKRSNWK